MPAAISIARSRDDLDGLREILWEFLTWDIGQLSALSGREISVESYVENSFTDLDLYLSDRGRLLLAHDGGELVGVCFLKPLDEAVCEIKRMYVKPSQRGAGLGKALLTRLIEEARAIGYAKILLDTTVYMPQAQGLYRAMGFTPADYYPEGETDEAFKAYMVYMELKL